MFCPDCSDSNGLIGNCGLSRHIVIGTVPPKPGSGVAAASDGGVPGFMDLEPWRCQHDDCKWVGYHKDPRSWQKAIGTHTWFFIHSVAAKYPENPSAADQ